MIGVIHSLIIPGVQVRVQVRVRVQAGATATTMVNEMLSPNGRIVTLRAAAAVCMTEITAVTTTITVHVPRLLALGCHLPRPAPDLASTTIVGKIPHATERAMVTRTVRNPPLGPVRGRGHAVQARVATADKMIVGHSTAAAVTVTGGGHGDRLPGRPKGPLQDRAVTRGAADTTADMLLAETVQNMDIEATVAAKGRSPVTGIRTAHRGILMRRVQLSCRYLRHCYPDHHHHDHHPHHHHDHRPRHHHDHNLRYHHHLLLLHHHHHLRLHHPHHRMFSRVSLPAPDSLCRSHVDSQMREGQCHIL